MTVRSGSRMDEGAYVLITGASSGIGAELAWVYAARGRPLVLWGRNAERLENVAARARGYGVSVHTRVLDLSDGAAAITALRDDDDSHPLDIVILAAGLGDMRRGTDVVERAEDVLRLGLVNYATPSAMAAAAAERMARRRRGHIVMISSVAAFHALPFAAAYSGSKAGLKRFAEAQQMALAPLGIGVTLVSPGFVDTPMSRRVVGAKPFLQGAPTAARKIARAVDRNRPHLVFPFMFSVLRLVDTLMPWPFKRRILSAIRADQMD